MKRWQFWYAWGLIAIILVAGVVLLPLSKSRVYSTPRPASPLANGATPTKTAASNAASNESTPPVLIATTGNSPTLAVVGAPESTQELAARTVTPYALELSVELPAVGPGRLSNMLSIPELGLRVRTADPQRWTQKIVAQRQDILRLILAQLSTARAEDLARPDADLYLKGLIANTVAQAIQLPTLATVPATSPPSDTVLAPVHPIEVLLPQGYRLR